MNISQKILGIIFFLSVIITILNIEYKYNYYLFLTITILVVLSLIFQILKKSSVIYFIILELFFFFLILHFAYQLGYFGLRGSDSYIDFNALKYILTNNYLILGQGVEGWPMIHILASYLVLIPKIPPLIVAKYFPSLLSSALVIFVFLISNEVIENKKIALMVCLVFATIPQFVDFESLFVREVLVIFLILVSFYLIYLYKTRRNTNFISLAFLLIPVLVLGHHFIVFMYLLLIAIYIFLIKYLEPRILSVENNIVKNSSQNIFYYFLTLTISLIAYWIFYALIIVNKFKNIYFELFGVYDLQSYAEEIELGSTFVSTQGPIIYYGFFIFHFIFAIILLYYLFLRKFKNVESYVFTIFFFITAFYGFLALYILGSLLFPQRFLPIGWLFGVIALLSILSLIINRRNKSIFFLIIISFVIFNIYNISPLFITDSTSAPFISTEADYYIARTLEFPNTYHYQPLQYYGHGGVVGAIFDLQDIPQREVGRSIFYFDQNAQSGGILIVDKKLFSTDLDQLKFKSPIDYNFRMKLLGYEDNQFYNKILHQGRIFTVIGK